MSDIEWITGKDLSRKVFETHLDDEPTVSIKLRKGLAAGLFRGRAKVATLTIGSNPVVTELGYDIPAELWETSHDQSYFSAWGRVFHGTGFLTKSGGRRDLCRFKCEQLLFDRVGAFDYMDIPEPVVQALIVQASADEEASSSKPPISAADMRKFLNGLRDRGLLQLLDVSREVLPLIRDKFRENHVSRDRLRDAVKEIDPDRKHGPKGSGGE